MERTSSRGPRLILLAVALVAAALVGSAAFGSGAVAASATDGPATSATDDPIAGADDPTDEFGGEPVGSLTGCFAGEGYPLGIGDPPTTIDAVVHLSVLTDPGAGNEFGIELAGTIGDDRIVTLAAGVRLSRAGLIESGLNPFAAFDALYAYELRLPMFEGAIGETTYEEEGSPLSSAAGVVPC